MDKTCDGCGNEFTAKRSDAKHCSPRCRTGQYRERHGLRRAPARRQPLGDVMFHRIYGVEKKIGSLRRALDDDRLPKYRTALAEQHKYDLDRMIADLEWVKSQLGLTVTKE